MRHHTAGEDSIDLKRPCYFLDKALHAQQAGADALLVVNDHDGDLSTAVAPKDEDSSRWGSGCAAAAAAPRRAGHACVQQQVAYGTWPRMSKMQQLQVDAQHARKRERLSGTHPAPRMRRAGRWAS